MHLTVPTENGEKRISIPCYDYMFVPAYDGQMAFCLSPSALMKLSSLDVPVEIPRLYSLPQQSQQGGRSTSTRTQVQVPTYRERFYQVFAAGRRFYRPVLLCLRLLLFLRLFGLDIESKLHFAALSLVMMGIMLYQTNALQPYIEGFSRHIPSINAQLPHAHPEVPPENNDNNDNSNNVEHEYQRPGLLSASVVMFLSSLVPNLHENWVQEDQRRSEHVQAVQRRLEEEQQEQEQEQRQEEKEAEKQQEEEDSGSESRYFDPPPRQDESSSSTAST